MAIAKTTTVTLSKSRFVDGLRCHRALWWKVHEPNAPELGSGPEQQAVFEPSIRVGDLARSYIPGGRLVDVPYWDPDRRIEVTRAALAAGAKIVYEASFRADDVFVSVDILHRAPRNRGWILSEVKSTTKVKPAHVPDAAVQTHVLRRVGLPIVRTEVMHLDRECRYPDLSNLFRRTNVTRDVEKYLPKVRRSRSFRPRVAAPARAIGLRSSRFAEALHCTRRNAWEPRCASRGVTRQSAYRRARASTETADGFTGSPVAIPMARLLLMLLGGLGSHWDEGSLRCERGTTMMMHTTHEGADLQCDFDIRAFTASYWAKAR